MEIILFKGWMKTFIFVQWSVKYLAPQVFSMEPTPILCIILKHFRKFRSDRPLQKINPRNKLAVNLVVVGFE